MAHLAAARPRVLYIALRRDRRLGARRQVQTALLETYARIDGYLRELWTWLQSQPDYQGRTHLLITTDHGRGRTAKDWRDHGAKVTGAEDVFIAFASPGHEAARRMARSSAADHQPDCRDAGPLGRRRLAGDEPRAGTSHRVWTVKGGRAAGYRLRAAGPGYGEERAARLKPGPTR